MLLGRTVRSIPVKSGKMILGNSGKQIKTCLWIYRFVPAIADQA